MKATPALAAALLVGGLAVIPVVGSAALLATPIRPQITARSPVAAIAWVKGNAARPKVAGSLAAALLFSTALCLMPGVVMLSMCLKGPRQQLRPGRGSAPPTPVRAASSLHGAADWMPEATMRRMAGGGHLVHGGVVFGTACRVDLHPDQDGGEAPLLVDPCLEDACHGIAYFGSGAGKTTSITIPNLDPEAGWRSNVLVNDPSSQVGVMCAPMRRAIGQRVMFIGPPHAHLAPGQPQRVGINVFAGMNAHAPGFEQDVFDAVEALGKDIDAKAAGGENGMFKLQGRALQRCLLADLLADPATPARLRTPLGLAQRVATPERDMKGLLETIHEESHSRMARTLAGTLMQAHPKTFSGFCVEATADLSWLMIEQYAELVSGTAPGSITADDFARGNVCAFLQLGITTMEKAPQVGRAIINAVAAAIFRTDGRLSRRYLLLMDEQALFGNLSAFSTIGSQGRKYGVVCVGMWHGPDALDSTYGEKVAAQWRTNASWEAFSAVDAKAAKGLSERLGKYTALAPSEGQSSSSQSGSGQGGSNSSGRNYGVTLQARPLLTPEEVEFGLRKDEMVLFKRGQSAPIRCAKPYYFRRPGMAEKVGRDSYRVAAE